MTSDISGGYHRDPEKMAHHYDIELVWCTHDGTETIGTVGHADHMRDTAHMLRDVFPAFPKSHWECWAPYMRGEKGRPNRLCLRIHHTADLGNRHWNTWRLWRPWREWLYVEREEAEKWLADLKGMLGLQRQYERDAEELEEEGEE